MTKIYKLLIDSPEYPKGAQARNDKDGGYSIYTFGYKMPNRVHNQQIEQNPCWELIEEKLDLRSPEAEKMREEARSKRWEYIPEENDLYYVYDLEYINNVFINKNPWEKDAVDFYYWNIGNCHRTREEARLWGEKYARYFLTE